MKAAGARKTVLLKVSAPFHCALMQPAQNQLASTLEGIHFNDPCFPVACNVDARLLTRRADVRDCLIRQVTGPVRWVECVEAPRRARRDAPDRSSARARS